ncbi:MAG: VWA domain-containing protein [Halanaerobiaceae bacterium]
MFWEQIEYRYPENIIYFIIPVIMLFVLLLAYRKKERILKTIRIVIDMKYKYIKIILLTLAVIFIAYSALGPQVFEDYLEVEREGIDIYLLFDTSKSMLVEDIKPSRIERGKKIVERILASLEGDRIGLIPFAADAYVQMPLTDDYQLAELFLEVIDTDMIAGGGSNIPAAINLAKNSFDKSARGDKVIVIISDGEEHQNNSLEAVEGIEGEDIRIFTLGIGTEKGGLIPVFNQQGSKESYMRDKNGEYVNSRLHSDNLKQIAKSGQGTYLELAASGEIDNLLAELSSLKRSQYKTEEIKQYRHLYQYFLGAGIILFITGYLLLEGRDRDE